MQLLDHLIRPLQEGGRDGQAERLRSLEVDDQLELLGLLDGQVGGIGAPDNPVHVAPDAPIEIRLMCPVGHKATGVYMSPHAVHGGQTALGREACKSGSMKEGHRVCQDQDGPGSFPSHCREGLIQLLGSSHLHDLKLYR
jgi:hypothetical protein